MYDIIDHELMRMGMDFTNLLVVGQQLAVLMCVLTGAYIGLIMRFIIVLDRLPACKLQETRTGNYVLIWSGLTEQE